MHSNKSVNYTNHIRRVLDAITTQYFSKIFCTVNYCIWLTERKGVVGVRKLRLCGCQLIHLHQKCIFLQIITHITIR
jgi:hypothetical protein